MTVIYHGLNKSNVVCVQACLLYVCSVSLVLLSCVRDVSGGVFLPEFVVLCHVVGICVTLRNLVLVLLNSIFDLFLYVVVHMALLQVPCGYFSGCYMLLQVVATVVSLRGQDGTLDGLRSSLQVLVY
ncbi:hypothetical protein HanXRQr2_Chr12g0546181 [Helianthus annuus]|uniref:Uncharacterized protein n=1 Tax=Helianthus annuus TaxID=4232 RepID=A0A9K3MWJ0_HELAN|nr:hypothetical protein HanXRQr2_Chr12g0546181 [Helianthus annuus]KAJ0489744.1 hypothetical protein HanHA300_Chr12g0447481 [Helianthus annuus]KAJ0505660.1 hypothetical protein HanHA89_Chr12g0473001 [Helianthus annuus]KAJ0675328.1 hypothetical protein HanLR1_Chr12g0449931 [Helianthus annuus]KAJ0678628.1 hypothetical protein HanOQP8_Chr12g0450041 [Helianthus annuus]